MNMGVLVGKPAPDFTAPAVMADNSFNDKFKLSELKGKYVVMFFYPLDFTFVCPTELVAFNHRLAEFKKRNCEVVSVSVDSKFSHVAWKNTPEDKGGVGQLQYPMVSDLTKQISRDYDVLNDGGIALRGTFLIDKNGLVRHQIVNDLPLGRNIDEAIRMLDALQHFETAGEVCPAGWNKGKAAMKPNAGGIAGFLKEHSKEL
jgi:peroxiredoxin (alkyl hydroperoxide reductase subunit C)